MIWEPEDLQTIAAADGLHIAPFRADGVTYRAPVWIWSVTVNDALYVRAYTGQSARWYRAALRQKAGRITAAGMTRDVRFVPVDDPINEDLDAAYRTKYHGSSYLNPMIGERSRAAKLKIIPKT